MGEAHPEKAEPSRLHLKVEFGLDEENEKLAEVLATVPVGPVLGSMVVSGGVTVVKVQLLLAPRALPFRSFTPDEPPTTTTW